MMLRYAVNQAEAFRHGVDCPNSIHLIKLNPKDLSEEQRNMIADRMDGIDVCQLDENGKKIMRRDPDGDESKPVLIQADLPTEEAFLAAIIENEAQVQRS